KEVRNMNVIIQNKKIVSNKVTAYVTILLTENGQFIKDDDLSLGPWMGGAKLFDTEKEARTFAKEHNLTILEPQ
ncbi:MAG: hypothetical protein AAB508_06745, partial [Patescibacteria group bacterium]